MVKTNKRLPSVLTLFSDKFGKKFWFDKVGYGDSDCGGVTCGLNSETETYCYDKGTTVFDENYDTAKIEVYAPQRCSQFEYGELIIKLHF